ncbi:MAG: hypothetical protein LQ337_004226, partial [Flavoplaca oasis]
MHVSILALHVFLILSVVKYGITKAAPPTIVKPLDNAASQTLQISRPVDSGPVPGSLMVPSIPDFRVVEYLERRNHKLRQVEMYCNSLVAMIFLIKLGWESPLLFQELEMTTPEYQSELIARAEIEPENLKNKHVIMVIHDLSLYFAPRSLFNYQSALGTIQQRPAVRVTLQIKGTPLASKQDTLSSNTTTGGILAKNPINMASLSDVPGKFIDPEDPTFIIHYQRQPLGTQPIYIDSLFTTFISALGDLAPHDTNELGARVNSVGYDRSTRLVILDAGTQERPLLSYGR